MAPATVSPRSRRLRIAPPASLSRSGHSPSRAASRRIGSTLVGGVSMRASSRATASIDVISSTDTRLASAATAAWRVVISLAHSGPPRRNGLRCAGSHTSSMTIRQFLVSSFSASACAASSTLTKPGRSPVRPAYRVVSSFCRCGVWPSVVHRMPSSNALTISSAWQRAAASVVLPNPPAPVRAVVMAIASPLEH